MIWRTEPHPAPGYGLGGVGWGGLIALTLLFPLILGTPAAWVSNTLPIGIAAALALPVALVAWRKPDLLRPKLDLVPPGDLLSLIRPLLAVLGFSLRVLDLWWRQLVRWGWARLGTARAAIRPARRDPERTLRTWPNAGGAWLAITALLLALGLWTLPDRSPLERTQVAVPAPTAGPSPAPSAETAPMPAAPEPGESRLGYEEVGDRESGEVAPDEPASISAARPADPDALTLAHAAPAPAEVPGHAVSAAVEAPSSGQPAKAASPAGPMADSQAAASGGQAAPDTAIARRDDHRCDPAEPFVFGHPAVKESLRLTICVRGADGPARLNAPPMTNALVALVQRHLNDLGYGAGPVDGLIGPRTRGAMRRFQQDQGTSPTGALGFDLLERLRSASTRTADPAGVREP